MYMYVCIRHYTVHVFDCMYMWLHVIILYMYVIKCIRRYTVHVL